MCVVAVDTAEVCVGVGLSAISLLADVMAENVDDVMDDRDDEAQVGASVVDVVGDCSPRVKACNGAFGRILSE